MVQSRPNYPRMSEATKLSNSTVRSVAGELLWEASQNPLLTGPTADDDFNKVVQGYLAHKKHPPHGTPQ